MILISLAAAVLAFREPAPPLATTWYEAAEAELTCTALADESERQSLNAPFLENPGDASTWVRYWSEILDERQNEFRYLGVLAAIGYWANRFNDQMLLSDVYNMILGRALVYRDSHPNDILFKQIARCARTHILSTVLESDQLDRADFVAATLQKSFASGGPSLPVEDWPLLLALREAALEPKARNCIDRLTKVAIDLAAAAKRANQKARAGRLLAAAAGGAEAYGDTTLARNIILASMTVVGVPAPQEVAWRSMPVLYDTQVRLTGEKDAATLSQMLTPPTPPAELIDQSTVVESYLRLARAAKTQERWADVDKFTQAAYQAVINFGTLDKLSLLFMRHALDDLYALLTFQVPAWLQPTLASDVDAAEKLLAQPADFVEDARTRLYLSHRIDRNLARLTDLREPIPLARERIDDLTFRLAQKHSFGRLTMAMVSGVETRLQLDSVHEVMGFASDKATLRSIVERFLEMATQNGHIRRIFNHALMKEGSDTVAVYLRPGQPPPNVAWLRPVMFTLDSYQGETTVKFSEYLAYLQRTVPTIAKLVTAHPLHLAEFQRLLRPGEAMVATEVTPFALYVWAITSSGVQVTRQRITEVELTNTVTRLRASLKPSSGSGSSSLPAFDAASAYKLYDLIFAPISDQLRDVRTIIWYGDGPLSAVPPAVLVTAPTATPTATTAAQFRALSFLVDRFAIAVLPDLSMFPQMRAQTPASLRAGKFLGIGAPLISDDEIDGARRSQSDALARGFTGKSLADLPKMPEAADEMKALAALFPVGESTLWLGPAADEHRFVGDRLLTFGTIAFATHGFLADEIKNYDEPSLMLALVPNANDRFDGILTATEIESLRLNADLVILSACNTAGSDGRPHGDAFTGLTLAFFSAGARNLMVSQWPVMSGAAVQLSVGTVERALNGKETLARSLQLAMQSVRKGAVNALEAHPAYWGPFVIAGDGR